MTAWMLQRVDEAIDRLQARRLVASAIIVPVRWTHVLRGYLANYRGCVVARLRAWNLLASFLNEEQKADLEKYNRFVTIGGTTGHRYMITSRTARDELRTYTRSLYDLEEKRAYCVHNWDVPPEEEMHTLNLLIQMPGYESYCRHLETA